MVNFIEIVNISIGYIIYYLKIFSIISKKLCNCGVNYIKIITWFTQFCSISNAYISNRGIGWWDESMERGDEVDLCFCHDMKAIETNRYQIRTVNIKWGHF